MRECIAIDEHSRRFDPFAERFLFLLDSLEGSWILSPLSYPFSKKFQLDFNDFIDDEILKYRVSEVGVRIKIFLNFNLTEFYFSFYRDVGIKKLSWRIERFKINNFRSPAKNKNCYPNTWNVQIMGKIRKITKRK